MQKQLVRHFIKLSLLSDEQAHAEHKGRWKQTISFSLYSLKYKSKSKKEANKAETSMTKSYAPEKLGTKLGGKKERGEKQ